MAAEGAPKPQGQNPSQPGKNLPAKPAAANLQPKNVSPLAKTAPAAVPEAQVAMNLGVHHAAVPIARPRKRHYFLVVSFFALVVLPSLAIFGYLYGFAADRYASNAAFSVHKEDTSSAIEAFSGLSAFGVSGSSTPDTDVIYQFIQSQSLVEAVDAQLDLRAMLTRHHKTDPIFSLAPDASLEDLVDYWKWLVSIDYAQDTRIISIEVTAFEPQDAQRIAQIILDQSSALINKLSKISRDDTINQAKEELDIASARLKETRLKMSRFRDVEQIVDPTADFAGQMGIIGALQQNLASALIRRDLLVGTTTDKDPRIIQAEREIEAIQHRISVERTKVGSRAPDGEADALSRVVGEYEGLVVDREFAEKSYLAALAIYDGAVADARRKSRYLAVHIQPTLSETAIYPNRLTMGILGATFLLLAWSLFALTVYSIRDRR